MGKRKHQKRHRITSTGFVPMANPALAEAMRERGSAGAGVHDTRPRGQRNRAGMRRAAIRFSMD